MKKLMTVIAAAATAFGLYAADTAELIESSVDFTSETPGEKYTFPIDGDSGEQLWYLSGDAEGTITEGDSGNFLTLDATEPVYRTAAGVAGEETKSMQQVAIADADADAERGGIIFDQKVKFTPFEIDTVVPDGLDTEGAKIAVWVKTVFEEDGETPATNHLMITAGKLDTEFYLDLETPSVTIDAGEIDVDEFHQLTITAIEAATANNKAVPGFKVALDDNVIALADDLFPAIPDVGTYTAEGAALIAENKLFPSLVQYTTDNAGTLQGVAFKGSGSVQSINISAADPFPVDVPVVKIGDKEYTSLTEAFDAAKAGDVLTLLADVTLTEALTIGKAVTFDLGGKTVTSSDTLWAIRVGDSDANTVVISNGVINSAVYGVRVDKGSAVTIDTITLTTGKRALQLTAASTVDVVNSDVVCELEGADEPAVYVSDGSTFNLDADSTITQEGNGTGIIAYGNTAKCEVNIAGAVANTYVAQSSDTDIYTFAICGNGTDKTAGVELNVLEGATVTSGSATAIYFPCVGELNIGAATITGLQGVYVKAGATAVIDGAAITATGAATDWVANNNGDTETGDAFVFEANTAYAGIESVSISGGTFTSANGAAVAAYGAGAPAGFITGGLFKGAKPLDATLIAEGYEAVTAEDGYVKVQAVAPTTWTVTLKNDETVVDTQTVFDGGYATNVVLDVTGFKGWTNETYTTAFDFAETQITADLTLFAWIEAAEEPDPTETDPVEIPEDVTAGDYFPNIPQNDITNANAKAVAEWCQKAGVKGTVEAGGKNINPDAFLLDCANTENAVENAKANFVITSITQGENGKWIVKVTGEKGQADEYGNGYVNIVPAEELSEATVKGVAEFFKAELTFTAVEK